MSFILDALKKSEIDRQRQSAPGLMDTPAVRRHSRLPVWVTLLAVLLGINIVVLLVVLMRNGAPAARSAPAHQQGGAAARTDEAPAGTPHFSPLDAAPVYAPEIPVSSAVQRAHGSSRPDPVLTEADAPVENDEALPSISEVNLTGAQALPELHLDVHVYATRSSDRFVYINMRKYHEGAVLQEGPTIERIRRDGVVLNFNGLRFLLPRQS